MIIEHLILIKKGKTIIEIWKFKPNCPLDKYKNINILWTFKSAYL